MIGTAGRNPALEGAAEIVCGPQENLLWKNTPAGALVLTSTAPDSEFAYGAHRTIGIKLNADF